MAVAWPWGTIQSLTTNVDSLSSEVQVLQNGWNNTEFMHDGSNEREVSMYASNSNLDLQLADIQKKALTIRRLLSEYRSKLPSDIGSRFREMVRIILESLPGNVQSRQRGIEGSVKEALAPFEQIFQTLKTQPDQKFPNS